MIFVEVNVRTLQAELDKLSEIEGYYGQMYASGAKSAINWLLHGDTAPSQTSGFPLFVADEVE